MRSLTTQETNNLANPGGYVSHIRVLVDKNGSLSYQDLTSLEGMNWVERVNWTETVDSPGATARIELVRSRDYLSLAPLVGFSKLNNGAPMLALRRRVKIETASIPVDTKPATADWRTAFEGYIDEIDPSGDTLIVQCRGLEAVLIDHFITVERTYGSTSGVAVQTVMQGIINDNVNIPSGLAITLTVTGSPNFLITTYSQRKQSVMEALRALAQQIAWDVRYRWNGTAFVLNLYQPARGTVAVTRAWGADSYDEVKAARQSIADIRNYITVPYSDVATGTRQTIIVQDNASILKYGLRPMEITEASTSQINTSVEATLMANAALNDLKEPAFEHTIGMNYFHAVEVGDSYSWPANNVHYDSAQQLAVVGYAHTFDASGQTTELAMRGQACGGYMRWLVIEGRSGIAPTAAMMDPGPPTVSGSSVGTPGTAVILYDPPANPNPDDPHIYTEVWGKIKDGVPITQSSSNGKLRQPSGTGVTMYVRAAKTVKRFEIAGLVPGATYQFAVLVVSGVDNIGQMALTEVTVPAAGPYHENQDTLRANMVPNGDLNIYSQGTGSPPDNWTAANFTWAASYVNTTNQVSGKRCIAFPNTSVPVGVLNPAANRWTILSGHIPVAGGDIYAAVVYFKALATGAQCAVRLSYYNASGVLMDTFDGSALAPDFTSYFPVVVDDHCVLESIRTVRVYVECQGGYLDRVYMGRGVANTEGMDPLIGQAALVTWPANTATTLEFNIPIGTYGIAGDAMFNASVVGINRFDQLWINYAGAYDVNCTLYCNHPGGTIANALVWMEVSENSGASWTAFQASQGHINGVTGGFVNLAITNVFLSAGDRIRFRVQSGAAGSQVANNTSLGLVSTFAVTQKKRHDV